jgi:hypothetical protein
VVSARNDFVDVGRLFDSLFQPTLKLYLGFSGVRYAFVGFSSLCPFLGRFCAPPAFRGPGSYVLYDLSEARSAQHLT